MKGCRTILVVDDEEDLVSILEDTLIPEGFNIIKAYDGEEALEILSKTSPDLMILDMNMPRVGGIEVYHSIANTVDGSPRLPVIILTARNNLRNIFDDFHVDGFMEKPFDMDAFVSMVHEVMRKHYGRPESRKDPSRKKWKILLMETEKTIIDGLFVRLEQAGHEVIWTGSPEKIKDLVFQKRPELILMGLNGTDLRGRELTVAASLGKNRLTAHIPILFYIEQGAARNVLGLKAVCADAGVHGLVHFSDLDELIQSLQKNFTDLAA